jgi:hypothetical protein
MEISTRVLASVNDAVRSMFFIKNHVDDITIENKCQEMIDYLFNKFPGAMPCPTSLSKHDNDIMDKIAIAMKR